MEPIAIVGMSCRFPGANNPTEYWSLLSDGREAIREVPPDRWLVDDYYDPDPHVPGKMNSRFGGFLEQVDKFDPQFFKISRQEAIAMDPQHRLGLELAWEALEDAGLPPERLRGSFTGVFLGFGPIEYPVEHLADPTRIDNHSNMGYFPCVMANRISYFFDFKGPSLVLDSGCSSSLLALHLACQSLRSGETTLALAGGVNLIITPVTTLGFSKLQVLSPDGRCKAFDASANGYVRGEGGGIVVLKKLSAAMADADTICAVIRATAVNQDGRTNGLMAPNRFSQEEVMRRAYVQAGVSPADIDYVETHGTGTVLGDAIETRALGTVVAEGRPNDRPCAIGSVKTNLGHLEAAAGIASLIKVTLALRYRRLPPSLHFQKPNPHIPFDELPLKVQQVLEPWPNKPAIAGVSSFGFGGTNVHVVVAEAEPIFDSVAENSKRAGSFWLPLSAHSPEALKDVAQSYKDYLTDQREGCTPTLADLCFSVACHRSHHDFRLSLIGDSIQVMVEGLTAFLNNQPATGMSVGRRKRGRGPQLEECLSALPQRLGALIAERVETLLLLKDGQECTNDGVFSALSSESFRHVLEGLGELYVQGFAVNWTKVYQDMSCRRVTLPNYPFQRQRCWWGQEEACE